MTNIREVCSQRRAIGLCSTARCNVCFIGNRSAVTSLIELNPPVAGDFAIVQSGFSRGSPAFCCCTECANHSRIVICSSERVGIIKYGSGIAFRVCLGTRSNIANCCPSTNSTCFCCMSILQLHVGRVLSVAFFAKQEFWRLFIDRIRIIC